VTVKVQKNDTVVVIAGRDKGARGKVIAAYPKERKVIVEGVNRVKKHTKIQSTQRGAKTGGIITQEAPIDVSNVMVVDSDGKPTRIGYRAETVERADGRTKTNRVRVSRKTGKDIS
jgi:large subunit ribosomal protein L24